MSRPAPRSLWQVREYPELIALGQLSYRESSRLRQDANQAALHATPPHERHILKRQAKRLAQTFDGLGQAGALEVLAAVGLALDDADWPQR